MSETQIATLDGADAQSPGVHSHPDGRDGSRTPPQTQYEIMSRHRKGMCVADICRQVGCDHRTVKAVIENWGTSAHLLRLQAHRSQLIDAVILSWDEAAKRGKSDSLRGWTDSMGITEPVKGQGGTQVAVQVNLHGGPEPVSLAKVELQSEGRSEQAHIPDSLIRPVMSTQNTPEDDGA